jgi:nuclear pore complex protein Nup188
LSGHLEGTTPKQLTQLLLPRLEQLRNVSTPFGKPSDASRKVIDGGSVTLPDGITLQIDEADKEFVLAISKRFSIDQVQALILLRSFLYNEGLPSNTGSGSATSLADELLEVITPFYFSERLSILRVLIPLFRANENVADPVHDVSTAILPKLLPNGREFADSLITEYVKKTQEHLPESLTRDPGKATRWAKQNNKEQLVLLEVLFWTMWGYVSCDGPIVVRIFEVAYETNLGTTQQHSTLLLNDEGTQLLQDCAALWMLITIEVLELERVAEPGGLEISADPVDKNIYFACPDSLKRIHDLVTSHGGSQHACTYLAWAFVLSRFTLAAADLKTLPDSYRPFFESLLPHLNRSYSKDREPTHVIMSRVCLEPDVGLFNLILMLLTKSPLFVTAAAWKTGSTVTDPNAIAFRSVLKGLSYLVYLMFVIADSFFLYHSTRSHHRACRTCTS